VGLNFNQKQNPINCETELYVWCLRILKYFVALHIRN
jgi:hypothetical protein